ncbi:restriction endonuclease subunit S, partial [Enterococcus faecium]|nr:restriction endonuclease subunit S [Enterococcus faecium]
VGKNKPVCIADEVPFEIPDTWEWVRLGSIGDWGSGATPSRSIPEYYGGDIPWLKTGDLNDGYIEYIPENISRFALEKTSVRLNPAGSVLIAMYGATIGKLGILTFPATTNQACCACLPIEICNEYLFYFLMSQKVAFVKQSEGGAQPNISKKKIVATLMPLPSLAEQYRIVAKIKEVLQYIERYGEACSTVNSLNKAFPDLLKKSILQEAVQGKLVPQDPADEPASILLERIRAEKEQLIKAGKIKRDKHESVIFRRDNSHYEKRGAEEICIDEEIPFDLPENWQWVRFSNIAIFENGDRSSKYPVESDYVSDGVPFFGAKDMGEKYMDFDAVRFIGKEKFKQLGNGKLKDGDLICLLRGSVGKTRIFKETQKYTTGFICAQMLIIRCLSLEMLDYVYTVINAPYYQTMVEAKITGTAVRQLPAKEVANLLIPIPPAAEQKRILKTITSALLPLKTL